MKIKFANSGLNVFGKKPTSMQDDKPQPTGVLAGKGPLTLREFAKSRNSTPAREREHYRWHLEARDSAEARRLDKLLDAVVVGVTTSRASALVR